MKRAALSIGMLLSTANIYCMDTETLSPLETAFEQKNKDGDTLLHIVVKHYTKVNDSTDNLNPVPFMDNDDIDFKNISEIDDFTKRMAEESIKTTFLRIIERKALAEAEVTDVKQYAEKTEASIVNNITNLHALKYDLNIQNEKGETALYLAAQYKAHNVVRTLLGFGANPNITDKTGRTPLMIACAQRYNAAVVRTLLQGNADVNCIVNGNEDTYMSLNDTAYVCIENTNAILEHLVTQSKATKDEEAQDKDKYASLNPRVKAALSTLKGPVESMSHDDQSSHDSDEEFITDVEIIRSISHRH